MILLDTNILLRYARAADPAFVTVDVVINALHDRGEILCIVPQNVYEFWATATRPIASNGLGLPVSECQVQVARVKRLFRFLPDLSTLFAEWETLVGAQACYGRVSFDVRLVAAMRTYGISRLLTFNGADFARFPGLTILDPRSLAAPVTPPSGSP